VPLIQIFLRTFISTRKFTILNFVRLGQMVKRKGKQQLKDFACILVMG
jgi:hypothetical protein